MQFQFVIDRNAVGRITRHIHYRALFIGNLCDFVGEWTRSASSLYGLFGISVRLNAAVIASLAHFPGSIGHAMINRRTMLQAREFRS